MPLLAQAHISVVAGALICSHLGSGATRSFEPNGGSDAHPRMHIGRVRLVSAQRKVHQGSLHDQFSDQPQPLHTLGSG